MSVNTQLQAQILGLQAQIKQVQGQLAAAINAGNEVQVEVFTEELSRLNSELARLRAELQIVQSEEAAAGPPASSGQIIFEEQQAREDNASVSFPTAPASVLTVEGRINPDNIEFGTDDEVRTQTNTQSTPPAFENTTIPSEVSSTAASAPGTGQQAGFAAPRDDNTPVNTTQTANIINAQFSRRITPRANVLDQYASYTYALSWYLLTPDQYNGMMRSGKKNVSTWSLLMQSAGAPTQRSGGGVAGRNPNFGLDYYMDDLEIDTLIPLKGTGAALSATDIRFRVTEPNGLTLLNNLYKAVSQLYKQANVSGKPNYVMAQYCMAVRFYGYDQNGDLVKPGRSGTNAQTNVTDPRAIVEKFYPFVITNIKFRLQNKVIEYYVEGKPIPYFANKSQDRGTIPFAFELSGQTLSQILVGNAPRTQLPPSQGERIDNPTPNTSAPGPVTAVNDIANQAGVNENGNFTGETASPFFVGP